MGHPHKRVNGQQLQMDKSFRDLKMKQRDKIAGWVFDSYKDYFERYGRYPDSDGETEVIGPVMDHISQAKIWIPEHEVYDYYWRKKEHLRKRLEKALEKKNQAAEVR
ncbi:MAG: hypothetical protein IJ733_20440 [Lachnospiraceae bacterium]|nr:hypothetical protein [Lachnospiraceae bacterium]